MNGARTARSARTRRAVLPAGTALWAWISLNGQRAVQARHRNGERWHRPRNTRLGVGALLVWGDVQHRELNQEQQHRIGPTVQSWHDWRCRTSVAARLRGGRGRRVGRRAASDSRLPRAPGCARIRPFLGGDRLSFHSNFATRINDSLPENMMIARGLLQIAAFGAGERSALTSVRAKYNAFRGCAFRSKKKCSRLFAIRFKPN